MLSKRQTGLQLRPRLHTMGYEVVNTKPLKRLTVNFFPGHRSGYATLASSAGHVTPARVPHDNGDTGTPRGVGVPVSVIDGYRCQPKGHQPPP
ncbi:MAG: hypothetical protein JWR37_3784 [Mycobacterium sp.]|nr:hypothetical protein [Mycobacterium sp.]